MDAPIPVTPQDHPRATLFPRVAAIVVAVFGFLPIANWIPGGHQADSYRVSVSEWTSGVVVSLGSALVLWILMRRLLGPRWLRARLPEQWLDRHPRAVATMLASAALAAYAVIARLVFSGRPLLIDEIVQVMQARIFATGALTLPVSPYPEFFSALHVIDTTGRVFSQFPPGGPLMLLPGVAAGVSWLVGPVFGSLSVLFFWLFVRELEERITVAVGAALLFAFAPFAAFMAGSHMNHVTTLTWLCIAFWGLQRMVRSREPAPVFAALLGLAFGIAATIRPIDAAAFAVPAAVWMVYRLIRRPATWTELVAAGVALVVPVGLMLWYNAATTGNPLLFGYELLWGKSHALGFHQAPWGVAHTPLRGLELVNLYFLRLQTYLFETPVPSLVPVIAALALTPRLRPMDRYLLWSSSLLVVAYFAYWHDGFFLGPRFFYPLVPALVLWTARLPGIARERARGAAGASRFVLLAYGVSAAIAVFVSIPVRWRQYAGGLTSMRYDYLAPARSAGLKGALILVRESWGSQLIARMWALGVPRSQTEALYRDVDSCQLEGMIGSLEGRGIRGTAAADALGVLAVDSSQVVESTISPDKTERVLPGLTYPPVCAKRILEDRAGYTFLTPLLASGFGGNLYARELHGLDSLLFASEPARPVFLLRATSSRLGAPLRLYPVSLDSARADWKLPAEFLLGSH